MQEVGKNKKLIKESGKENLFSTSITKLTVEEDTVAYRQRDEATVSRRHSRDFGSRRDRKTENNPGKR